MGQALAQNPIDTWKDYLSYSEGIDLDVLNGDVYVAGINGVFIYHTADNSIDRLSRVNGLSDIGLSLLRTNDERGLAFVGYSNGNIDLIEGNQITNFAELKNSSAVGSKTIRDVTFYENIAFITSGLGIHEFNLDRVEIKETYSLSPDGSVSVNATAVLNDTIYAATDEGLYFGSLDDDLTIFSNWQQDLSIPGPFDPVITCVAYNGRIYISHVEGDEPGVYYESAPNTWQSKGAFGDMRFMRSAHGNLTMTNSYYAELSNPEGTGWEVAVWGYSDGIDPQANAIVSDGDGVVWIADRRVGLVKRDANGNFEFIRPQGPGTNFIFDLDLYKDQLWMASGGVQFPGNWNNRFELNGFYGMKADQWTNYVRLNTPILWDTLFIDVPSILVNRANPDQVFVGSNYSGLCIAEAGKELQFFNSSNSELGPKEGSFHDDGDPWVGVSGMAMDREDNLWICNTWSQNPLVVYRPDGTWESFSLSAATNSLKSMKIIIDDFDQKWIIFNRDGIVVFKEGETPKRFSATTGSGGLPANEVLAMVEDLDGEIWVGTTDGVAVFYSPFDALTSNASDARRILVEQNGIFQYLLEGQAVTAIAVDGANRKWIGTESSGVFLMSEDGTEEIKRFTDADSPLFSSAINDIAVDDKTGEVFIATQGGLISYFSDATGGESENNCSSVYPNPVRETYSGPISITGLKRDSQVRITDARGNLIYKTVSNGGSAIWDGKNTDGVRVATGVYYALSTDVEGASTCVTKILLVK